MNPSAPKMYKIAPHFKSIQQGLLFQPSISLCLFKGWSQRTPDSPLFTFQQFPAPPWRSLSAPRPDESPQKVVDLPTVWKSLEKIQREVSWMPEPPSLALSNVKEQHLFSELLSLSLKLSRAIVRTKLILAACICALILLVSTQNSWTLMEW